MRYSLPASAAGLAAACVLSCYLLPTAVMFASAGICVAALIVSLLLRPRMKDYIAVVSASMAAGFLWFALYGVIFYVPAVTRVSEAASVYAEVSGFSERTEYGSKAEIRVRAVDGYKAGFRALMYYDGSVPLNPGDVVEFNAELDTFANTRDFHALYYYKSKGIYLTALADDVTVVRRHAGIPPRYIFTYLPHYLKGKLDETLPADAAAITNGIVLGVTTGFSSETRKWLADTGTSHVASVSGMHLSYLVGFLMIFVRNRKKAAIVAIPAIILMTLTVGAPPSMVRAAVMHILMLVALLIKRESDALTSLSFALLILLIVNPFSIADVGLQLSFTATLGLILFSSRLRSFFIGIIDRDGKLAKKRRFRIADFMIVTAANSISAMAFTIPLTAIHFGNVSLIAPLANLFALWAVSLIFLAGIFGAAAALLIPAFGFLLPIVITPLARYFLYVISFLSRIPFSSFGADNPYMVGFIVYLYAVVIALCAIRGGKRAVPVASAVIISLCLSVLFSSVTIFRNGYRLAALDVGQGQSLVFMSDKSTVVVDCGGNKMTNAGVIASEYIRDNGRGQIDMLILTHFHADHTNGVETLMKLIDVNRLIVPDTDADDPARIRIIELAGDHGVDVTYISSDTLFSADSMDILVFAAPGGKDKNEQGISVMCRAGSFETLTTGDLSSVSENALMRGRPLPDIEVLVVGHHGSKYSSSDAFLETVKPELAIISVGRNNYGHPTYDAMLRLFRAGARVLRTDMSGKIAVTAKAG